MKKILWAILFSTILVACKSSKPAQATAEPSNPKPEWVKSRPITSIYYTGIGVASKKSNPGDFAQVAKNNALSDISSEISVNISSTSVLSQIEKNFNFREDYESNTKTSSNESLEGYELMDTWEDNNYYYAYYRLDKETYERIKREKREKAISFSKDFYNKAIEFEKQQNIKDAIIFKVKAIEGIKDYFGDALQTTLDGKQVFYGNELLASLTNSINSIKILPVTETINVKRGQGISDKELQFQVFNENGKPINNLPIYLYYSGERISNNEISTNSNGIAGYNLSKVSSSNPVEYFQANVNLVNLAKEATEDALIRKLIGKLNSPEARVSVKIEKPKVYIHSIEKNLGAEQNIKPIATSFKSQFSQEGFIIANSANEADFIVEIEAHTDKGTANGNFHTAFLNATIKVTDGKGNNIYSSQINNLKGVQLNFNKAGTDAYKKAVKKVEEEFFTKLKTSIFG